MERADGASVTGRVVQVNVSLGGVPKRAIERAWVGRFGLEGDAHREDTVHGGPHRAVSLLGIEAIGRVRAEGHPIAPGTTGENLTTEGVDWSTLAPGTRLRLGNGLELELSKPVTPCRTIRESFHDGRFGRLSIQTNPADSRMYARVLREGEVRAGDPIEILPPRPDSAAAAHNLLDRLDACERESNMRFWEATREAGYDLRIFRDGELAACASPELPGPPFNQAHGLRALPNLLPRVLDHFRAHGVTGWLSMHEPPWPGAQPDFSLSIASAIPDAVPDFVSPDVAIRRLPPDEADTWGGLLVEADPTTGPHWRDALGPLLHTRNVHVVVAELHGTPVGVGRIDVHARVALLRAAVVVPSARGRGIQRALIATRARLARDLGCDTLSIIATPGTVSERNALAMGFTRVAERGAYRYDPRADEAGA